MSACRARLPTVGCQLSSRHHTSSQVSCSFYRAPLIVSFVVIHQLLFCRLKQSAQVQYNCNTRIFFLYCSCIALVRTPAIQSCNTSFLQLAENLQATCSSCKNLYCACADCCNTTKLFVLCYCSCIVVVLHLCRPLYSVLFATSCSLLLCYCILHL